MLERIKIEINNPIKDIKAVANDKIARELKFQFLNKGVPENLTGSNVRIYAITPKATEIFNNLIINDAKNGVATLQLTNALTVEGIAKCQLKIFFGNGGVLSTQLFNLISSEDLMSDNAFQGTNEYKAFEEALKKIDTVDAEFSKQNTKIAEAVNKVEEIKTENSTIKNTITQNKQELKNEIATIDEKLERYKEGSSEVNITKAHPNFHTTLYLADWSALQCFVVTENNIYATQVYEKPGSGVAESFIITRMDRHGNKIDSMIVKYGGHGSSIAVETENGQDYIWSAFARTDSGGNILGDTVVRFPYSAKQIVFNDPSVVVYKETPDYAVPYIDFENNKIALRIKYSSTRQEVELYNFDEFKNKRALLLKQYLIPQELNFLQGFAIEDYTLYWRTGEPNTTDKLSVIDLKTNTKTEEITLEFGKNEYNEYDGGFREPEGLFLYKNKTNNKRTIFIPITLNSAGKRISKSYMLNSENSYEEFDSDIKEVTQQHILIRKGGYAKLTPPNFSNSFRKISQAGTYYFSGGELNSISDKPSNLGASGGWLEVSAKNFNEEFYQIFQRNNINNPDRYIRVIRPTEIGTWLKK